MKNKPNQIIPPKKEFISFESEKKYEEKGREWGLFNKTIKKEFLYKNKGNEYKVVLKGFQPFPSFDVVIVEFEDGSLSCIHQSYLKEMQTTSFNNEIKVDKKKKEQTKNSNIDKEQKQSKEKPQIKKIVLPTEKVLFEATIKEFNTKYNSFADKEEEIIIFEKVKFSDETFEAWCGYSNKLKKMSLEVGSKMKFEAKIVEKKFNKEIIYKINNPSKIELI